jgi:hypothetical protein
MRLFCRRRERAGGGGELIRLKQQSVSKDLVRHVTECCK